MNEGEKSVNDTKLRLTGSINQIKLDSITFIKTAKAREREREREERKRETDNR